MLLSALVLILPALLLLAAGLWHAWRRARVVRIAAPPPGVPATLPSLEWAQLLFEEWRLRQEHFWSSLFRWGGVVVALTIVPYLKPELATQLQGAVLLFPCLAAFMGLFGAWHLASEYARQRVVAAMLDEVRQHFTPPWTFGRKWWHRPLQLSVGWAAPVVMLVGAVYISSWNFLLLNSLYRMAPLSVRYYQLLVGIGVGLFLYAACYAFSERGAPRRPLAVDPAGQPPPPGGT
ncbi:MAG TPA: hypothetical protein VFX98_16530 [Longimicrobiaceae bacterium]|nr:hypothetical protein [Longimicrobiaceae bacterium]